MRSDIDWVWLEYKSGACDLTTAAIVTNTAIIIVRKNMEEVLPFLKPHGGPKPMLKELGALHHRCMRDFTGPVREDTKHEPYGTTTGNRLYTTCQLLEDFDTRVPQTNSNTFNFEVDMCSVT
ncbi:hypothetical protein ANO14919_042750 [Xylariales sp. No.14919]|nr:hypothetical protein ANO14919_042750 [Xylariales sp. No.14919]